MLRLRCLQSRLGWLFALFVLSWRFVSLDWFTNCCKFGFMIACLPLFRYFVLIDLWVLCLLFQLVCVYLVFAWICWFTLV